MPELAREVNAYLCELCGGSIITITLIEGTTPFTIKCRAKQNCNGMMQSTFYRVPPVWKDRAPTHEWFMPDDPETYVEKYVDEVLQRRMLDHFQKGGLVLRERTTPDDDE